LRWSPSSTRRGRATAEQGRAIGTDGRDGRQKNRGGTNSSRPAESSEVTGTPGRQKNQGDRGLRGSDGFEAAFPETPHGGRVLDNRRRSANLRGQKRAFVKRRTKRSLFGWDFTFLRQKLSKKRNQNRVYDHLVY
jgi:hypothetical protein